MGVWQAEIRMDSKPPGLARAVVVFVLAHYRRFFGWVN